MITSNWSAIISSSMRRCRSSLSPWKWSTLKAGAQFSNSRTQLRRVDLGASTRYGRGKSIDSRSQQRREMVCSVLPRPISSARMPLMPWRYAASSQLTPTTWCGCSVASSQSNSPIVSAVRSLSGTAPKTSPSAKATPSPPPPPPPPEPRRARCCSSFLCETPSTFSSTVASVASLTTVTGRCWPIRWQRSIACWSMAGLKSTSWRMTVSADVRLMPRPPARVESRKRKMSESLRLNASIMSCRSEPSVEPSMRQ
mmetsp:Transcript_14885/g.44542  ORF Transcript_14885/g.44542 Transcript_14885/m.44542 type:complete len:255 (-) Transcript_14885:969-1733(-)